MQRIKFCITNPRIRSIASRLATRLSFAQCYLYYFEYSSMSCARAKFHFAHPRSGFTLFELIVTIAIIAIIAVMAAPSFASMYSKQKLESSAREIAIKISEARAQAVTLRSTTGMCLSSLSEASCITALGITDPNKNKVFVAHLEKGITVDSRSETHLIFRNNGSIAAASNFILLRNGLSYCIAVGLTGDTRIREGACT